MTATEAQKEEGIAIRRIVSGLETSARSRQQVMMRLKFDYDLRTIHDPNESFYISIEASFDAISLTICRLMLALLSLTRNQSCNCDEKYPRNFLWYFQSLISLWT